MGLPSYLSDKREEETWDEYDRRRDRERWDVERKAKERWEALTPLEQLLEWAAEPPSNWIKDPGTVRLDTMLKKTITSLAEIVQVQNDRIEQLEELLDHKETS